MQLAHQPTEYSKVTDNIFLGTNLCCMEHCSILDKEHFDCEIDLEGEPHAFHPQTEIYLRLPVPDMQSPSVIQLQAGVAMIDEIVKQNRKVYVHCRYGQGRSPELVIAYFVFKGMPKDEAISKVTACRPRVHLDEAQVAGLDQYIQNLNSFKIF